MRHRGRFDVARRVARLDKTPDVIGSLRVGADHLCDWSTEEEFAELAKLVREAGLPLEAEPCQVLLRLAWQRRVRREPRKIFVGVLVAEGREAEAEEELRRRKAWGLDR